MKFDKSQVFEAFHSCRPRFGSQLEFKACKKVLKNALDALEQNSRAISSQATLVDYLRKRLIKIAQDRKILTILEWQPIFKLLDQIEGSTTSETRWRLDGINFLAQEDYVTYLNQKEHTSQASGDGNGVE